MKQTKLLLAALIILLPSLLFAQQKQIKGKVTDETGLGIPDASVSVKGTTITTITDASGNFTISIPETITKVELRITHIGYPDQSITVSGNEVSVTMQKTAKSLDEVIVVGYGTQKKRDITGAVATFNTENLDERPVPRVDQAMVGQMAGVRVKQTSGLPGRGFSVQIRGTGSIGANNEPLYVIDGFPLEVSRQNDNGGFTTGNPLDNLNPNDIESIQVLKDASAAAIYGSRGSNGVVLITTKKGKTGKATISFNAYAGYNERVRKLDMLDAEGWIDRSIDIINTNWVKSGAGRTADQTTAQRKAILGTTSTNVNFMIDDRWLMPGHPGLTYLDWQDEFFKRGTVQNYQLSATGGNENVRYYVSGNYFDQKGITHGVSNTSYSVRANVEVQASNKLKFGLNIAPTYSIINDPGVDGKDLETHIAASLAPVVEEAAGLQTAVAPFVNYAWAGSRVSPVERVKQMTGENKLFRTLGTIYADYTIIKGLSIRSSLNLDNADATRKTYVPFQVAPIAATRVPTGGLSGYKRLTFVNENTISYIKTFKDKHNVSAVAGMSYNSFKFDNWSMTAGTYTTTDVATLNASTNNTATSTETKNVLISYFGRVQYDFDNRYLFSASIRKDGSSKFGDNTKWGVFPAFSLGWRISEEKFMQSIETISELKIRGSWGITGNNGYDGDYNHLALLSFANYSYGGVQSSGQILNTTNFPNPDLSWEESETINIGLDLGLFKNRIITSFDVYNKRNSDLLLRIPVPLASGFSSALTNIGEVVNKGWELEITTRNIVGKGLTWTTSINLSHNTNKVEQLGPNNTPILFNGGFDIEHSILTVGEPMYSLYLVQEIGLLTTQDITNGYPRFGNQEAGDPKYLDANKDGKIDANDRVLSGHPNPDYIWGINNTFSYKGFDLGFLIQGQNGGKIYSMFGRAVDRTGQGFQDNALASYANRWRSAADDGKEGLTQKAHSTFGRIKNTDWMYSSDYWRVRTITLGYNLGGLVKNKKVISGARLYITAENMFGKDKYDGGWNPEAVNTTGEDYGSFPIIKRPCIWSKPDILTFQTHCYMKTKFILYILILATLTACEKKLDQVPISQASAGNFFRNTADFEQAVNGIYQALHNIPNTYDYAVRQNELAEVRSDNIYSPGTSGVRDWLPINNFDRTLATNPNISGLWNDDFNGILRANTVLDKLSAELVPDNTTRDRMEGEAKFFRAFYYFDLVRYVGKVPIFDHVATPTEALTIPRSPVVDVYTLIVSDLQTAITKLPNTYPTTQKGKVTADAAKGILALVYLTRSGPNYGIEGPGLATNELNQALTLLDEIINGNRYALQATYPAVFGYTNENNTEILFDMQSVDPGTTANAGLGTELPSWMYEGAYGQKFLGFAGGVDGDGPKVPSNSLRSSFEAADTRDDFSILPSYTDLNGNLQNRAQFVKFLDLNRKPLIRFNFAINYPILRYADVLLMKAEAILRGGTGTQADVDALVKRVRDRAGLTASVWTNVTLDSLLAERRREFMAEGKRWHDLVRTGKVLTAMAAFDASDDVANKMNAITSNDIIYPIPFNQLSISPGLYTQNPGY